MSFLKKNTSSNVLYTDTNVDVYILTDKRLTFRQIEFIKSFINKNILEKLGFCFIYVLDKKFDKKLQLSNFKNNSIDLKRFIPPNSKILTLGKALLSITQSDNLYLTKQFNIDGFYDFVFNKTYFYAPDLKSYVFPVDNESKWLGYDNWERFFTIKQLHYITEFRIPRIREPKLQRIIIDNEKDFESFLIEHADKKKLALDIETTGLDFTRDSIECVTFAFDENTGYYIPWRIIDPVKLGNFIKDKYQILAGGKFDFKFLLKNGVPRDCLYMNSDIVALAQICNELTRSSLKASAWLYTSHGGYDLELERYKKAHGIKKYSDIPPEILNKYAVMDAILTFRIHEILMNKIKEIDKDFPLDNGWSLLRYYEEIRIPTINLFVDVEYNGMYINIDNVRKAEKEIFKEIDELEDSFYQAFNFKSEVSEEVDLFGQVTKSYKDFLNIKSSEQLGTFLEKQGWECVERSKKGHYKTNKDILLKWENAGHEEASILLRLSELKTFASTFIGIEKEKSGMYQYLRKSKDGKYTLHPNFYVMLARSHRNRCSNPNLQNYPKHGKRAEQVRSFFCPPSDDYYVCEWDASGLQLRIHAIFADDKVMKNAFADPFIKGDLHSVSGQNILMKNVSLEDFIKNKKHSPYKEYRFKSKAINFSIIFNTGSFSFAEQSIEPDWSIEECKDYIKTNNLYKLHGEMTKKLNHMKNTSYEFFKNIETFSYYWTVADHVKEQWLNTYPDTRRYLKKQVSLAHKQGYVRNPFGIIRRLPQLLYVGKDTNGSKIKNLENMALNSPVQGYEAVLMMRAFILIDRKIKRRGLKSIIIGNVHDSGVMYIHKDELDIMVNIIKTSFEEDIPENQGVPMKADIEIADYSKDEYWGFGREI